MFLAEVIGTFLFVNVNVNIIFNNGSSEIILNAIIIGAALILGLMVAAPISGAAINPAVGAVLPVLQSILHGVPGHHIVVHIMGPYVGGLLAGLF
jgi:glycerol uptake facilitator-like aquaporin